jgi:prevent-host-death family protein
MKEPENGTLGVGEAKRRFSELADRVARGERFVISRRGRPAVALVPVEEAHDRPEGPPKGALSVVGALAEWDDIDDFVKFIYEDRRRTRSRPAPDLG